MRIFNREIMIILSIFIAVIFISFSVSAFTETDTKVAMEVQIILAKAGELINGEKNLRFSLMMDEETSLWGKSYSNVFLENGEISVRVQGEDDNGNSLIPSMFDSNNVFLRVEVDEEEVDIDLISQPYAIKSRLSDQSFDALSIQNMPVKKVTEYENEELFFFRRGEWSPLSITDRETGLLSEVIKKNTVESLKNVKLDGILKNDTLAFDGSYWVNIKDPLLTTNDVVEIILEKEFMQEYTIEDLVAGDYSKILGVGDLISISEENIILKEDVYVEGDLIVTGSIGSDDNPIQKINLKQLTIDNVNITNENELLVDKRIRIEGKTNLVLTGVGSQNTIGVFKSESLIGHDEILTWDFDEEQLAIGGVYEGVNVNIEGLARVKDNLIISGSSLDLSNFVKEIEISDFSFSGSYLDLKNVPDINVFKEENEFLTEITSYYTTSELDQRISDYWLEYQEGQLRMTIKGILSEYEKTSSADLRVQRELTDYYYSETEASDRYYTQSEIDETMSEYSTNDQLGLKHKNQSEGEDFTGTLLGDYMLASEMSYVGYTGEYDNLYSRPNILLVPEFELYQSFYEDKFVLLTYLESELYSATSNLKVKIMDAVALNFVTKVQLAEKEYGYQDEVDNLSEVARTGDYSDLLNSPDISQFRTEDEIDEILVSFFDLKNEVSLYMLDSETPQFAKTGDYNDLIDAPDSDAFFLKDNIDDYVLRSAFDNVLDNAIKVGENFEIDLTGVVTNTQLASKLSFYSSFDQVSTVAETNSFEDLGDKREVILTDELNEVLENYVTLNQFEEFQQSVQQMKQIASTNISEMISSFNTEMEVYVQNELESYDKSVTVNQKISDKTQDFINTDLNNRLIEEQVGHMTDEDFINLVDTYATSQDVKLMAEEKLSDYVSEEALESLLNYYLSSDYFNLKEYFNSPNADIIISDGGSSEPILINSVIETSEFKFSPECLYAWQSISSVDCKLIVNYLRAGDYFTLNENSLFEITKDSRYTNFVQFTNSETGTSDLDGFFIGIDEDENGILNMKEAKSIVFGVNNSESARIDADGDLGIGVSDPQFKVDITGDLNVSDKVYLDDTEFEGSVFSRGETDQTIAILDDESLYIGTGTPETNHRLEVEGAINASAFEGDGSLLTGINSVPTGLIVMWSGEISDIPENWSLCNGSNGTPNLSGRFLVQYSGSGSFSSIGSTGGSSSTTLSSGQLPSHSHSLSMNSSGSHSHRFRTSLLDDHNHWDGNGSYHRATDTDAGHVDSVKTYQGSNSGDHTHTVSLSSEGSGNSFENRPPYYVLAFIQFQGE